MIIFNTTYHASLKVSDNFVEWLCCEYIPAATKDGVLLWPQLARVMSHGQDADGNSYALQFHVESLKAFQQWHINTGRHLNEAMKRRFGTDVVGFSTWMEKIVTE